MFELQEVVVTAQESRGNTSASVVSKEAIEHLQPSSFSDLVSMLPGQSTKAPNLTSANTIRLREAGDETNNAYSTGSLGTSFVIDGAPISTDANMQYIQASAQDANRQTVNSGVDMRAISTDDIEKVEVIRGIASAEYGDVTSGVVKIERTIKPTPWKVRFKADGFSKLFYFGKGLGWNDNQTVLNFSIDYLNAKSEPTNTLENYQRITGSVRLQQRWANDDVNIRYQTNLDYTGSIDNDKVDPDIHYNKEDSYNSQYHRISWTNTLNITPKNVSFWTFAMQANTAYSIDRIHQTKYIQLTTPIHPVLATTEEGNSDVPLLPYHYVADYLVDGQPLNIFLRPKTTFIFSTWILDHKAAVGIEYKHDKNYGAGQVYDKNRPLNYSTSYRPRAYNDIPANNQLSWYINDNIQIPIKKTSFDIEIGLRGTSLIGLKKDRAIHRKVYIDPRTNITYTIPVRNGSIHIAGAIGQHTKMPTLLQLYPNKLYEDMKAPEVHVSPKDSTMNIYTHIIDPTNKNLTPARNLKWEVRLGGDIYHHHFSVTYFQEKMNDGFRSSTIAYAYTYPIINEGVSTNYTKVLTYSQTTNGSKIKKQGLEFQYASPRIPVVCTRFTLNGAWLRTTYSNSEPMFSTEKLTQTIGNTAIKDIYIGYYNWTEGTIRENFNTNVIADVYIQRIGLTVSATMEMNWYSSTQTLEKNGTPIAYMDQTGEMKAYTEESAKDPYLQWLIFSYNPDLYRRKVVPFAGYFNLRIQKTVTKYANIAFFVNKLLDILPDYNVDGVTIHRQASPYFGMELNLSI